MESGTLIKKVSSDSIVGAINYFNDNVINRICNQINWSSTSLPHFSGTTNYGTGINTSTVGWTNPQALPSNQFDFKPSLSLSIPDTILTVSTLWSDMLSITRTLGAVRKVTSNWYHKDKSVRTLKGSLSGIGIMNTTYPAVPSGTDADNAKSEFWDRSGSTSVTLNPETKIIKNTLITASEFNTTVSNCYNTWYNNCITNTLTYNFYTCHVNCHSNCHGSRSRR